MYKTNLLIPSFLLRKYSRQSTIDKTLRKYDGNLIDISSSGGYFRNPKTHEKLSILSKEK